MLDVPFLEQRRLSETIQPLVSNRTKWSLSCNGTFTPQPEYHTQLVFTGDRDLKDWFASQNQSRAEEGLKLGSHRCWHNLFCLHKFCCRLNRQSTENTCQGVFPSKENRIHRERELNEPVQEGTVISATKAGQTL